MTPVNDLRQLDYWKAKVVHLRFDDAVYSLTRAWPLDFDPRLILDAQGKARSTRNALLIDCPVFAATVVELFASGI